VLMLNPGQRFPGGSVLVMGAVLINAGLVERGDNFPGGKVSIFGKRGL
jgi:hypothetical protein